MSCASEGGRPKRVRNKTEKGAPYSRQLLYVESKRIIKRLKNQKELFSDLLSTTNVEMMNREVAKLDDIQNQLLETYTQIRESLRDVETSIDEEEQLQNLVEVVDTEEAAVFEIKKDVSAWMVSHCDKLETGSVGSGRSSRSRNSSQHSRRSGRSGSMKSGSSRRSGSRDSVRSVKSDGSRTSRVSRKAEVAGLKAKVDILRKDGKQEIQEEVNKMRLDIELYEKEQTAILKSEIVQLENEIIQQDDQYVEDQDGVVVNTVPAQTDDACLNLHHLNQGKDETGVEVEGDKHVVPADAPQERLDHSDQGKDETGVEGDKHVLHVLEQMNALTQSMRRRDIRESKQTSNNNKQTPHL